jgi:hypothetical protein
MWAEGGARARAPGVPLKPMLAKICEGIADGLKQLAGQVGTRRARARGAGAPLQPASRSRSPRVTIRRACCLI